METEERFSLEIVPDSDPVNPWEDYDHASRIVHWHRRGFFGESIIGREREWYEEEKRKGSVILPLYLYEHGGQTISLRGFSDPWDSGQVGFVYVTKEQGKKEGGRYWRKWAVQIIRAEVKQLDQYLTGDVWGYVIKDRDGEEVESCWGFYGEDYCRQEGERALKYRQETQYLLPLKGGAA